MQTQTTLQHPKRFDVRSVEGFEGPTLWIEHVPVNFEHPQDVEALHASLDAWLKDFYMQEAHRQAEADIDDEASRDGDRNHELTMAFGGPVL